MTEEITETVSKPNPSQSEGGKTPFGELRKRYERVLPHVRRALFDVTDPKERKIKRNAAFIAADSLRTEVDSIIEDAKIDSLTRLNNLATFKQIYEHEVASAKKTGEGLVLLFVDLNKFKDINTALGHEGANRLLAEFGGMLGSKIRPTDTAARIEESDEETNGQAARYGGDEFVILLSGADKETIEKLFNRINLSLAMLPSQQVLQGKGISLTISMGASAVDLDNPSQSFDDADHAMYEAKKQSKLAGDTNSLSIFEKNNP
ncbi:MAG: GGDEF domain-containing protein [Candidatus Levybacteria bacterium]|nr:GGDEF domain-containing protein [Candidatus Levybacteria bacterium]